MDNPKIKFESGGLIENPRTAFNNRSSQDADAVSLSRVLGSAPDAIDNLKHSIGCYIAGHGKYPPVILTTQKQYGELLMAGKRLNLYTDILAKDRKIFGIPIDSAASPDIIR